MNRRPRSASNIGNRTDHRSDRADYVCYGSISGRYPNRGEGSPTPKGKTPLDGENMLSVLQGNERQRDRPIFMQWAGNRAMIEGEWKIVYDRQTKRWELFNLASDRAEMINLSDTFPDQVARMTKAWHAWAKTTGVGSKKKK